MECVGHDKRFDKVNVEYVWILVEALVEMQVSRVEPCKTEVDSTDVNFERLNSFIIAIAVFFLPISLAIREGQFLAVVFFGLEPAIYAAGISILVTYFAAEYKQLNF